MLLLLFVVLTNFLSCRADDIFPEALVFEGLGLTDIVNDSVAVKNHNDSVITAGDLNDALMTMTFHRYNFH